MFTLLADYDALMQIIDQGELIPLVAIVLGCLIAMVAIVSTKVASVSKTREVERTRRELAAYVAEGSLGADQAVAMLNAGARRGDVERTLGCKTC